MVEHSAVNRVVVGSSPTRGVWVKPIEIRLHGQAVKTSPFHGGNRGSIPLGVTYADMAQLAEQLICNQQVNGSSPFIGFKHSLDIGCAFFTQVNSVGFCKRGIRESAFAEDEKKILQKKDKRVCFCRKQEEDSVKE